MGKRVAGCNLWNLRQPCSLLLIAVNKRLFQSLTDGHQRCPPTAKQRWFCKLQRPVLGELHPVSVSGGKGWLGYWILLFSCRASEHRLEQKTKLRKGNRLLSGVSAAAVKASSGDILHQIIFKYPTPFFTVYSNCIFEGKTETQKQKQKICFCFNICCVYWQRWANTACI